MKFDRVIGIVDTPEIKKAIIEAENKLTALFLELSTSYEDRVFGSRLGGDVYLLTILSTSTHIADVSSLNLPILQKQYDQLQQLIAENKKDAPTETDIKELERLKKDIAKANQGVFTAATTGKVFYWSVEFINKLSRTGLRFLCHHEANHAIYLHASRRGLRKQSLYNIVVDFKTNASIMNDLRARKIHNPVALFENHLGKFINLNEYGSILNNPYGLIGEKLTVFNPIHRWRKLADPKYKHPGDDKNRPPLYYAESELPTNLQLPERIYDHLQSKVPHCKVCNRVAVYEKPEEVREIEKKLGRKICCKEHDHWDPDEKCCKHDHTKDGFKCDDPNHCDNCGCPKCNIPSPFEYIDPFVGDLMDRHMEIDMNEEELAKKMNDAANIAKQMGQGISGEITEELTRISKPVMRWQDFILHTISRKRQDGARNNYSRPKRKPIFAGLFVPTRVCEYVKMVAAYDCSASMDTVEDIGKGIGQLAAMGDKAELFLVGWDAKTYWEQMVKVKSARKQELMKAKVVGRGSTSVKSFFDEYEEKCGKDIDIIVIITDGYLGDNMNELKRPSKETQVVWLITSHCDFKPPWGRTFHIRNERL